MKSLRTKITVMTLLVVIVAVTIVTILSVFFIIKTEHRESDQLLLLLCEIGQLVVVHEVAAAHGSDDAG